MDKEDTTRTIFGIGRKDGSVLNSLAEAQQKAILNALASTDELDAAYCYQQLGSDVFARQDGRYIRVNFSRFSKGGY